MIEMFKNLFGRKKEKEYVPDPPGRTFKRIDTGKYFGCEDKNTDENQILKAKQRKLDQITELGLIPMFLRYSYRNTGKDKKESGPEVTSAHVVFQKEVTAEKWNMTHVTEISFTIEYSDFDEFEKMSGVSLDNDFRNLTSNNNTVPYNREERRKKKREP